VRGYRLQATGKWWWKVESGRWKEIVNVNVNERWWKV